MGLEIERKHLVVGDGWRGVVREEVEIAIPMVEARRLLASCGGRTVEKLRHLVVDHGMIWTVDEFVRPAPGLLLAEIELDHADQPYVRPDWVGAEVTLDPRYSNSRLAGIGRPRRGPRPHQPRPRRPRRDRPEPLGLAT